MGRNSYGIPVGPYASRLLGEAILIDVDAMLQGLNANFVRWVDDYNIFCKTEHEAQSVLFSLGEWLFTNHGLTLQTAKTKILPIENYRSEVLLRHDEQITDRDTVVNLFREFRFGYDDEDDDPMEEEEVQRVLESLQEIDLRRILQSSISDSALVDYETVASTLTKIPRIPGISEELKREILELAIDNAELLYPVAEQIAKYILSFENLSKGELNRISTKLLKPLKSKRNPAPPYYAMWILHIFSTSADWNHAQEISTLYSASNSEIVKRHAAIAINASGNRAQALRIKDDFQNASPLLKLAILFATKKLGVDERKHWKVANGVTGVIEKLI